jgi:acetyltransferase-like isoleucine patch superfamily enzyme
VGRPVISPHAIVDGQLGDGCEVQAFAVIGTGATLGPRCQVGVGAVVGAGARLGAGCVLHPHAVVSDGVELGDLVEVFPAGLVGRVPKGAGATAHEPEVSGHLRIGDGCSIGPHATVYYGVEIGAETLVGDGASIREGARIGSRCMISRCVTLNYDVHLGDGVKILDSTHITGRTWIGDGAFVSTMVATANDNSPTEPFSERIVGPRIEPGAVIGAGATLLPGVRIGARAVVGAGAVVTRDVADGVTVMGVPARPVSRGA